jgi:hypothetical protein
MHWMTSAGPTAFRMKPRAKAKVAGIPNRATARPPSKKASRMPGTRSSLVATHPTFLKICTTDTAFMKACTSNKLPVSHWWGNPACSLTKVVGTGSVMSTACAKILQREDGANAASIVQM